LEADAARPQLISSHTSAGNGDNPRRFIVIGAGPAGLTAAYKLQELGHTPTVLEKSSVVGGLSRTERYKGYRFDMGGHRFYSKSKNIQSLWSEWLGPDLLKRRRLSRIYYNGAYFDYPLKPLNALAGLGPMEGIKIVWSYLLWSAFPRRTEETFEDWVSNRFGKRLFETFFKCYTEKVWGISCKELRAEWAEQRIKQLSLGRAVANMFFTSRSPVRSLISEFHYPRLGPGMLWSRVRDLVEQRGGHVSVNTQIKAIRHDNWRVTSLLVECEGKVDQVTGSDFISSMPITELIKKLEPAPPGQLLDAANRLHYRDFLTVCLIVKKAHVFDDNWIYIHDPGVDVARIQNFKNWSPDMVPDSSRTSLGLEYFCQRGDQLWNRSDSDLIAQAGRELEQIGLARSTDVEDGCVFRIPCAYPVYDSQYRHFLELIKTYIRRFENLQSIGRNGLHRYNNQDHAMLTGIAAVRNAVCGEAIDLWSVNSDDEYLEEVRGVSR
jgi:protoporphyrinogen oxidase